MGGWRAWFCCVNGEGESGFGSEVEALVGEFEIADEVMVEVFDAGAVGADVVGLPAAAELLASGGQLADEFVQPLVVGVFPGRRSQVGDG